MDTVSPSIPGTNNIIAPYAADIDPSGPGKVRYTAFSSDSSQLTTVSVFVQSETGNYFYGTRMMIAEWRNVPLYSETQSYVSLCIDKSLKVTL